MSDLKLDSTGDIVIENGDFVLLSGVDLIAQNIKQRLKLVRGDSYLDTRLGIPYYTQVFVKRANNRIRDTLFQETLLKTTGVTKLTEYSSTINDARELTINFRVITSEGPLKLQVLL